VYSGRMGYILFRTHS